MSSSLFATIVQADVLFKISNHNFLKTEGYAALRFFMFVEIGMLGFDLYL